jgi:hypothetical protein
LKIELRSANFADSMFLPQDSQKLPAPQDHKPISAQQSCIGQV